jgi:hypothetical protein
MHLVLSDKIALDIKVSLSRPSFFVHVGQVSAYVCLEDTAPAAAGLPFYERRKWRIDIATERLWQIGRLAISLAMPRCTGSALAKRLARFDVGYETRRESDLTPIGVSVGQARRLGVADTKHQKCAETLLEARWRFYQPNAPRRTTTSSPPKRTASIVGYKASQPPFLVGSSGNLHCRHLSSLLCRL